MGAVDCPLRDASPLLFSFLISNLTIPVSLALQ